MYNNIIGIIVIILIFFFISGDNKLEKIMKKKYFKIVILLILIYCIMNKINIYIILIFIVILVLYYSNFKNYLIKKIPNFSNIKDKVENFVSNLNGDNNLEEEKKKEEELEDEDTNELFNEIELLESKAEDTEEKPFQEDIKKLRDLFNNLKSRFKNNKTE